MMSARLHPLAVLTVAFLIQVDAVGQCEARLLTRPSPRNADYFGCAVAVSGDLGIIGAWGVNKPINSGAAFLFDLGTGERLHVLKPAGQQDLFGMHVDLEANHAVGGAYWAGLGGRAYLFDASDGSLGFVLEPADIGSGDRFGRHVGVSAGRIVVGAYWDGDLFFRGGSAYVFDAATGQELFKLTPSDGHAEQYFGWGVSVDGDRAVLGALNDDTHGPDTGAAYLFDVTTGKELFKLYSALPDPGDDFGFSVAIQGDRVIVGSPEDEGVGAAYVFDATTGQLLLRLLPSDGATGDLFGFSVALHGDRALVGARSGDGGAVDSGAAYLFELAGGHQLAKLGDPGGETHDRFGGAVALGEDWLLVGAQYDEAEGHHHAGSATVYGRPDVPGTSYCTPANDNSTGGPAALCGAACGHLDSNYLALVATGLPPNESGYFMTSAQQGFVPNPGGSQGNLCLGGDIGRFADQVASSGAAGVLTLQVDLTALPTSPPHAVLPGETWNFQAWFRDHDPGATSNFTDGVSAQFPLIAR